MFKSDNGIKFLLQLRLSKVAKLT